MNDNNIRLNEEPNPDPSPPESSENKKGGFWNVLRHFFSARNSEASLKESLEEVIDEHNGDFSLGEEEKEIIRKTLSFSGKRVDDVMVPRADIISVSSDLSFRGVVEVFKNASCSRLPIYRETLDEVIAMVHIKDALKVFSDHKEGEKWPSLKSIQRPILFVPPSMKLSDLLTKMQRTHIHMALVVDEYGGTDGLLTIEDLVEQIVGDIEDEHDGNEAELLFELPSGHLKADARLPIEELEELLGLDLLSDDQDDEVDTLGGLIFTLAGHIPKAGEIIEYQGGNGKETLLSFEIIEADERRIKKVLIYREKQ
jgi:CBS domain containing-hemolysin-like protein